MTQFNMQDLFKNVQTATQQASSNSAGQNRKYPYRSVYVSPDGPNVAQLTVRLLPNQKDNIVTLTYGVHKVDKTAVNCGLNDFVNNTCEVCRAVEEVKAATGVDPRAKVSNRGALFAQYISSIGYKWTTDYPAPKPGEIIIVQGPASLHHSVNSLLSANGPAGMNEILVNVQGPQVSIMRDQQAKQIVATALMTRVTSATDANGQPSQEAYNQLLASLPSLRDTMLFGGITETDRAKQLEMATALRRTLRPSTAGFTPDALANTVTNAFGGVVPQAPAGTNPFFAAAQTTPAPQFGGFVPTQPAAPAPQFGGFAPAQQPAAPMQQFSAPQGSGFGQPAAPTQPANNAFGQAPQQFQQFQQPVDNSWPPITISSDDLPFKSGALGQPDAHNAPVNQQQTTLASGFVPETFKADLAVPSPTFGFNPAPTQQPNLDSIQAISTLPANDKDRVLDPRIPTFCPKKHNSAQICKMCVVESTCPFKTE